MVELRAAVALLGRFPALSGVDLTIHAGETILLRGPNGAGKTTLLHLCAGLLRPESGSVQVLDHDLTDSAGRRSVRRRVALLGHTAALYEDLTVGENLRFWARAAGLSAVEADRRLDDARKRLEVSDRLVDQPVHTLSAGQRRRTSLAALLARRPDLWLLDEPHAGLDQSGRDLVDGLIGDAVAAGGTVVVSSHELDRVAALSPTCRASWRSQDGDAGRRRRRRWVRGGLTSSCRGAIHRAGKQTMSALRVVLSDIRLVAARDLRIEARSRVVLDQVLPFAVLVLVLFGFALDADHRTLRTFAPGLFWVAVLLSALLAVQRAATLDAADGTGNALRMSGLPPVARYLGRAAAVLVQLLVLEAVLVGGLVVLYGVSVGDWLLLGVAGVVAGVAVAAAGTLYGALASGLGARDTLLPVLVLPVLAPVLIGATRAFDDALGSAAVDGWAWTGLLAIAALVLTVVGASAHGALVED